jgi:MarR family
VARWTFLSNHGRVLLCIARDPEVRLREIAADLGVTERSAFSIVNDLADGGYIVRERDGRRNRYEIHPDLPLPEAPDRVEVIGEVLNVLAGTNVRSQLRHVPRAKSELLVGNRSPGAEVGRKPAE